jgi:hypothetical protein
MKLAMFAFRKYNTVVQAKFKISTISSLLTFTSEIVAWVVELQIGKALKAREVKNSACV